MEKSCRECRKFGGKLFLKGPRCLSPKCAFTRRSYAPGSRGAKVKTLRRSEYGSQLFEKQKAKAEYGLRERQFVNFFRRASRSKAATGEEFLRLLEKRLDNIIYRVGWAASRKQARQLVGHRKIKLNGKITDIASVILKPGDIVTPKEKTSVIPVKAVVPKWLKLETKELKAEVLREPKREEMDVDLDEQKISEFYSR